MQPSLPSGLTVDSQQPTQPAAPKANFFERLLPTAGGILGGIAGGAADVASLGALAPIINPVTGAAAGGALGKLGENAATHQSLGNGVLSSAILNGVGQGVGGKVAEGIQGLASGASGLAAKGASKLFAAQGPGVGEDLANFATQHLGINDLPTAAKFGEVISGSTDTLTNPDKGLVSKMVEDAAAQDPSTVDVSNLQPAMKGGSKAAVQSQAMTGVRNASTPGSNLTEQLISDNGLNGTTEADGLRSQIGGVLGRAANTGSVSKTDLLGMQKQIAGFASDATDAANRSGASVDAARAKVLNGVNSQLKTALGFDTLKVAPKQVTALANDIITNAGPISQTGAAAVAKDITDAANSEEGLTVGQVRNMESNMVRLQQTAKSAISAKDKNFGTSTADLLPTTGALVGIGGKKSALGTLAGLATSSSKADAAASGAATALSKLTGKAASSKILPLLTRASAVTASNIPNDASPSVQSNSALPLSGQGANQMNPTTANPQQDALSQLYNEIISQSQSPTGISGNLIDTANTLAPLVNKQQLAAPVLANLLPAYNNAGGAQGAGGGLLSRLSGLIPGTAANTYSNQQAAAAAQLASILGITPAQAQGELPQLMQSQSAAAPQISGLQSILSGISPSAIPAQ